MKRRKRPGGSLGSEGKDFPCRVGVVFLRGCCSEGGMAPIWCGPASRQNIQRRSDRRLLTGDEEEAKALLRALRGNCYRRLVPHSLPIQ